VRSSAIAVVEDRREQKLHQITDDQKATVYKSVAGLLFDVIVRPCKDTTVIFHHPRTRDSGQGLPDATRLPPVKK